MILNDVGAQYDNMITDVSPRLAVQRAVLASSAAFVRVRAGYLGLYVFDHSPRYAHGRGRCHDPPLQRGRLVEAGVLRSADEIRKLMWHGGSHHIGYDVHDVVERPAVLAPNMVFCVDVGVYHEEWGIGFRLEDNCLVTETGCETFRRYSAHHCRYRSGDRPHLTYGADIALASGRRSAYRRDRLSPRQPAGLGRTI